MKIREVRLMEEAFSDLSAGRDFYDRQDTAVGDYFLENLLADIGELRLYSGVHPVRFGYHRLLSRRFPYAVYYEYDEDEARVVAILDMRRSPRWIRQSLSSRMKPASRI